MQVRELNQEQLLELKWKVFYDMTYEWLDTQYNGLFSIEEWEKIYNEVSNAIIADEISNETIYTLFEHYSFVKEDFGCNFQSKSKEKNKMTRKRYIKKMARKIASYVYAVAVLESGDANWCIYFDEIEDRFGVVDNEKEDWKNDGCMLLTRLSDDEELVEAVLEELYKYDGLEGSEDCAYVDDGCFDINLWHDYRATFTDLDEEELGN